MADTPRIAAQIARAIVHLNFNEPDQACNVLLEALTDFNFPQFVNSEKENQHGNTAAIAQPAFQLE